MPEFLARPNLPNSLANSLVQLAANEANPIADLIKQIGSLAEQVGGAVEKKAETKAKNDQDVKLKQMDIDARREESRTGFLTELVKNDQIVASMLGSKPAMSSSDASQLLGGDQASATIGADFGVSGQRPNPAAEGGIPTEDIGLTPGYTAIKKGDKERRDANRWVTVDNTLTARFPALKGIEGKDISTAQYLGLQRGQEMAGRYKGVMDDKLWARALTLANSDMEFIQASMDGDEAKISEVIERKKRIVSKTGGRVGAAAKITERKELGSIIADAFEKGLGQP